ncbi:hypothetical protein, partial [Thiolapillus sp.]
MSETRHTVRLSQIRVRHHDLGILWWFRITSRHQACLRPRDRFWDIPVPKIDSAFDNLLVPQPSWSPSTTQQLRKLVAAPYLAPNDWTPRSEAYFVFPLAQGTPGKQCGLAATGVYQPSLRSPWLAVEAHLPHLGFSRQPHRECPPSQLLPLQCLERGSTTLIMSILPFIGIGLFFLRWRPSRHLGASPKCILFM